MQRSFSHGLLYSVAPEYFSELHLYDKTAVDEFEWEEEESAIHALIEIFRALFQDFSA